MAYESRLKDPFLDDMFQTILSLETVEECYRFFEDLCTVAELKSMAQRLAVARMLWEDATYSEVEEKSGASSATISRVNRSLHYGAGGYRLAFEKSPGRRYIMESGLEEKKKRRR